MYCIANVFIYWTFFEVTEEPLLVLISYKIDRFWTQWNQPVRYSCTNSLDICQVLSVSKNYQYNIGEKLPIVGLIYANNTWNLLWFILEILYSFKLPSWTNSWYNVYHCICPYNIYLPDEALVLTFSLNVRVKIWLVKEILSFLFI